MGGTCFLIIVEIIILITLVTLSAFFSGSETALFSLSRARLLSYKKDNTLSKRSIVDLMESYHYTLIALILGNMFVNIGVSITQTELYGHLNLPDAPETIISILTAIFLLLIFGEVSPKAIAISNAEWVSNKVAFIILMMRRILFPLIWLADKLFSSALDLLGRKSYKPLNHEEYNSYIEMAHSVGVFSDREVDLLEDAFDISKTPVSQFTRSRMDLQCLSETMNAEEVTRHIIETRDKFFPVIKEDLDDAEFILSAKDFFMIPKEDRENWQKAECLIPVVMIPENTNITKACATMKDKSVEAALTLDEYGGTLGLIEIEHIYELLVGDIDDEHDEADWHVRLINPETVRLNGKMSINELEEVLEIELPPKTSANTLSGVFAEHLDRLPLLGDKVTIGNYELRAIAISKHRVIEVEVKLPPRNSFNSRTTD